MTEDLKALAAEGRARAALDRDAHAMAEGWVGLNTVSTALEDHRCQGYLSGKEQYKELIKEPVVHHGELWLGEGDYVQRKGVRTVKPDPRTTAQYCAHCRWPLPLKWGWSDCEFGEQRIWWAETLIDDDPLLYRVWPWMWQFCKCNGCLDLSLGRGRPLKYCSDRCRRDADNARDRESRNMSKITAAAA